MDLLEVVQALSIAHCILSLRLVVLGCACPGYPTTFSTTTSSFTTTTTAAVSTTASATTVLASTLVTSTTTAALASMTSLASAGTTSTAAAAAVATTTAAASFVTSTVASATQTLSQLGTAISATSSAGALATSGTLTPVPCLSSPPLSTAVCINGNWFVPDPNAGSNATLVVMSTPIIFIENATLSGGVIIYNPTSDIPSISAGGCVTLIGNNSLNITVDDPETIPTSLYVINSTCVIGNFSEVRSNYRTCTGRGVFSEQRVAPGRGLSVILHTHAECSNALSPVVVAMIVTTAVVITVLLACAVWVVLKVKPHLVHKGEQEDIHFLLSDDKQVVHTSSIHKPYAHVVNAPTW